MHRSKILLCIGLIAVCLTACQKETSLENANAQPGGGGGGTSNGTEVGTWNFVSARVSINNVAEGNVAGLASKMTIDLDATSDKNTGTVKFDGKEMSLEQVGFAFDDNIKMAATAGGFTIPPQDVPFQEDFPAASESYEYKKIGTDSLYFSSFFLSGVDIAGNVLTGPAGAKLKWDGNKLTMTIATSLTNQQNIPGMGNVDMTENTAVIITLQKP